MTSEVKDYRKLGELLKESISRIIDMWDAGEGDFLLEIRDGDGHKTAKIKGGMTTRIK